MEMNGGFLVTKIKQLGDRIFEKILNEKNIDAFNGAQGRILYVLWQEDGISIRSLSIAFKSTFKSAPCFFRMRYALLKAVSSSL